MSNCLIMNNHHPYELLPQPFTGSSSQSQSQSSLSPSHQGFRSRIPFANTHSQQHQHQHQQLHLHPQPSQQQYRNSTGPQLSIPPINSLASFDGHQGQGHGQNRTSSPFSTPPLISQTPEGSTKTNTNSSRLSPVPPTILPPLKSSPLLLSNNNNNYRQHDSPFPGILSKDTPELLNFHVATTPLNDRQINEIMLRIEEQQGHHHFPSLSEWSAAIPTSSSSTSSSKYSRPLPPPPMLNNPFIERPSLLPQGGHSSFTAGGGGGSVGGSGSGSSLANSGDGHITLQGASSSSPSSEKVTGGRSISPGDSPVLGLSQSQPMASTSKSTSSGGSNKQCRTPFCIVCEQGPPKSFQKGTPIWSQILHLVLYSLAESSRLSLAQQGNRSRSDMPLRKKYFHLRDEIYEYIQIHWDIICKRERIQNWKHTIGMTLSHYQGLFKSGYDVFHNTGYWCLKDEVSSPYEPEVESDTKKRRITRSDNVELKKFLSNNNNNNNNNM
ncbi:hypothetical protein SAMD00019534_117680 [Acytostelium subglobosum LB1]|uniref:hypothetical protein n=1 Tax=Acytostelium subglobosum LB1 TaxID=1410327 RepID=UPI00064517A6|nr:hypothetical protein SAMD00019534_117680 [Acytostelium subglobosum LB1]GAM28592.1 hypothetical protein SAMD00019534_117680 [Acytostelium subglobosum LB1]|eukprot:XP_012748370.1 hypothetical protein SAMD00019534_117680 [Acytostelium subglobosum LB1]